MTALEQLNTYLRRLELRLRLFAASRGAAITGALALGLTVLLVWISNRYAFAERVVFPLRILFFLALAAALSFALAIPLLKLNRRRVTRLAERQVPGFEERLLTVAEKPDPANPFTELVAEDALRVAGEHQPEQLAPSRSLFGWLGSGLVAAAILLWLVTAGPGYWGYGASLLWTGSANSGRRPLYDIAVQPGNKTIRRKSDQLITAQLFNFSAHNVTLHARYGGAPKWEETTMQPEPNGNGYRFLFAGLSDAVEYYVEADKAQSKHFSIQVRDLPGVKRVRVALHFPKGLGLKDAVQDPGGDVRAVKGSQADISVLTDRPLEHGFLVLENGSKLALARGDGNWMSTHLPIEKDGSYHIAALDGGEAIRISDDYYVEAKKDEPPSVKILRPGGDPHVSPIEEVPVTVEASDDFGLEGVELHYSVNGGAEQVVPLLKSKGIKEAEGTSTLYFENFKVVPGDLVSFYATARDATTTSRSDIVFAQAEPFDFKFTQSQQMGGGGGMGLGNREDDISSRQKQIIAATWNEIRTNKTRAGYEEDAKFLSDLELKLSEQAKTLAERMSSRELDSASKDFQELSKEMKQASSEMTNASGILKSTQWKNALPPEQKALQALLRVEATFRDIQVAFGQNAGGGMGGGGAQRDLARMFDLELDTTKNQYETGQSPSSSQGGEQQKAIDEAFERLQALARRQQELAAQNNQQQGFEQRWQEEQLRREAEELRQQMQQLSQSSQGQQQSNSSQQGSQQSASSSSSSQSGSSSQSALRNSQARSGSRGAQSDQQNRQMQEAMRQAMNALQRAEEEMRKAVSDRDKTAQQRAAAQLAEAQSLLNGALHQQAGNSVSEMAQRAQRLADAQRDIANRMKDMYGQPGSSSGRTGEQFSARSGDTEMPEMNDPNPRYGFGYRRRYWQPEAQPTRPATEQEKALAAEKDKLAQQVEQLERQMQQQEQDLAGSQPEASSKLQKALSDAEQKELAMRMQKNAEWMRQGYGDRNAGMEDSVTAGLEQLSRDLRDVQQALKSGDQSGNPPGKNGNDKESQALAEIRALRDQLERADRSGQLQREGGELQRENQESQPGGQQATDGSYAPRGDGRPGIDQRGVRNAIQELNGLRAQIDPRDRALYGYIDGALWNLRHLTGAVPGVLDATISQDAASSLERLEVELNRRVGQQQAEGARTGAPEPAPEKYRDAVAEYFKKLSQPK